MESSASLARPVNYSIEADALFVACICMGAVSVFMYPINHDVAWLLSVSDQIRLGARHYVDVIDVSPPLIAWIGIPFAAAADLLRLNIGDLFRVVVILAAAGSVVATARLLRAGSSLRLVVWLAAAPAAAYDFGQREHLALLASLPYIATAMLRFQGTPPARGVRLGVALPAAMGLLIKPHFLLVPMLVEGWLLLNKRPCKATIIAFAGSLAVYGAAVALIAPQYIAMAGMLAKIYAFNFLGISPWAFLHEFNFQLGCGCLLASLIARNARPASASVLSCAALGFALSAATQAKGWSYHWYPFFAISLLALGAAVSRLTATGTLTTVVVLANAALLAATPFLALRANPFLPAFRPLVEELGGGKIVVLSNTVRTIYPLVTLPGNSNASRLPVMQLLSASILQHEHGTEKRLRATLVEDFVRNRPDIVIVENHPREMPDDFDFLDYLSQDPAFGRELASLHPVRKIGRFTFYQRR
ncbi:hypothetical protein [Ramlibacter algicola]|uniref:Uncharacterized protein n=1 Tax=Ramlibacter algicola TaxID=2795217 RepID=A0A934Q2U1_9BURK|nr:hypothetical protein [Ramlibacter algicola]MBK0394020.1 hypothetical protein [Ramlibacter algicola]